MKAKDCLKSYNPETLDAVRGWIEDNLACADYIYHARENTTNYLTGVINDRVCCDLSTRAVHALLKEAGFVHTGDPTSDTGQYNIALASLHRVFPKACFDTVPLT